MSKPASVPSRDPDRLRITEIFFSIQGEAAFSGYPTSFIRLTGCPLRCGYCDTRYAFHGGDWMDFAQINRALDDHPTQLVTITGGEPLAQVACRNLITHLCDQNYRVSIETSGALSIADLDPRAHIVMDIKTPGSGEVKRNLWANIAHLKSGDQVKFVVCDYGDYEWLKQIINEYNLIECCEVLLSPAYKQLDPSLLAGWMLGDGLSARLQIQLHKHLWGDEPGR